MDFLKKFWPYSFKERTEVSQLVIAVIIYVVASILLSVVTFVLAFIPFVGGLLGSLVGGLGGLYCTAGIVFTFLSYFKVLK